MDATLSVREFLKSNGIHNFWQQKQGAENKVIIKTTIVLGYKLVKTQASLYRPNTKNGDPRIWVSDIKKYCKPNDILAFFVLDGELQVFNLTDIDLDHYDYIQGLLEETKKSSDTIATELITKLRKIARHGLLKSEVVGDTGIGRTIESALGIKMNSLKTPDYRGIEIKSFREAKQKNRKNLFAQVPDWSLSNLKSSAEILDYFGYEAGKNIKKLYVTVKAITPNAQSLYLRIDDRGLLFETSENSIKDFAGWKIDLLKKRLEEKHKSTFWVAAKSIKKEKNEYFQLQSILHTKGALLSQFVPLIEQKIISVDHLIKKVGNGSVNEKGPIFKISSGGHNLLFPSSEKYLLNK